VVAAVTLATSYMVYSLVTFHVSPAPVYSESSFSIYGSPSFLHLRVNATSGTSPVEFRIDGASSLSGILRLTTSGYSNFGGLCAPGSTTFFAVLTAGGTLTVSGSGKSWIDGVAISAAQVQPGWHELIILNGSGCSVTLPGGGQATVTSSMVSSIPVESSSNRSFLFLIPYYTPGHVATIIFDGGTEVVDF